MTASFSHLSSLVLLGGMLVAFGTSCSSDNQVPAGSEGSGATGGTTGGGTGGSSASTSGGNAGNATAPPAVGNFTVRLVPPDPSTSTPGYTTFLGVVRDGPPNEGVLWDLVSELGGCQLVKPRIPFCDPPCATGQTCVADGVCRPDPAPHSVGTVTLKGLTTSPASTEIVMNPVAPGFVYQPAASVNIDYPPASEGAEIAVSTSGGDYPALQLKATGIVPLELLGSDPVPMPSGQPMALSWTPKGSAGKSRIQVKVEISHHGGAKGAINCDVEDTGSLSVADSLVTGLINLGVAGFPTVTLSRVSTGSFDIAPGRVDLLVVDTVQRSLSIPGFVSCTTNADCPSGQTCTSTRLCGT